jgi:lon-related putative ATP-dependent protease
MLESTLTTFAEASRLVTAEPLAGLELAPEDVYRSCDLASLPFATTAELEDLAVAVGQGRALAALEFGVGMRADGYNLFVLGRSGSQRRRITETFLQTDAAKRPDPLDWCYLNNFDDDRKPIAVSLPRGRGGELRRDMARLVDELRSAIPAAFESDRYRSSLNEVNQEFEERQHEALEKLQEEAKRDQLSLVTTPHGFAIAPTRKGELIDHDEFERLPAEEREKTAAMLEALTAKLRQHIEQLPRWHKEHRDRIAALNREVTELAAGQLINQLAAKYAEFPALVRYLAAVRTDVLQNAISFLPDEGGGSALPFEAMRKQPLTRYEVNVLVDHADNGAAPIVYESNPSVQNLLGRIEHVAQFGALLTNFTMIRSGALHRANGGYLILDADRLLMEPLAWPALKRTLFAREIKIESLGELLSLVSTVSIEPQPVALDLKVILIGERFIYYLLCELDPDFGELFKVAADFENGIDRTPDNTGLYARMIATLARREGLLPLGRDAVARVIEHSARLLGDSAKLTTRLRDIADLLREADYWARTEKKPATERVHVQRAIDAQIRRLDRLRVETQESIARNLVLIDTTGETVGQVNGLSVLGIGSFAFGQPSRITASVRVGSGEIVDIERETELGGRIHSKGVLILSAYLGAKYAIDTPLSLAASLVFEQSYGGVEGDSASIAETCALLSALADLPIRQWLAVTGSVNQRGQAQVISGVNEKIEGFFDTCAARGLDGRQGVLIPRDNVPHLMLRADVVEAVRGGRFHIYPIASVDDAIALLTGVEAGARDARGAFPKGTVNYRVERRVRALADSRRRFARASPQAKRKRPRGSAQKPKRPRG